MVAVLLAERSCPRRNHYAPMDAAALERYRILSKLGVFPVEMTLARGAAQFLRTGLAILPRRRPLGHPAGPLRRRPRAPARLQARPRRPRRRAPPAAAPSFRSPSNTPSGTSASPRPSLALRRARPPSPASPPPKPRRSRSTPHLEAAMDNPRSLRHRPRPRRLRAHPRARPRGTGGFYALGQRPRAPSSAGPSRPSTPPPAPRRAPESRQCRR